MIYIIPINLDINQNFNCNLPLKNNGNQNFNFDLTWNPIGEYWQLTIKDLTNNKSIINSKPLYIIKSPYGNLLEEVSYKEVGSLYLINLKGNYERPTYYNLSSDFLLAWSDGSVS